jgi:dUTPase
VRLGPRAVDASIRRRVRPGWDLASAKAVTVPARGKAIVPTDLAIATP